jgi:replicative DNA helicase
VLISLYTGGGKCLGLNTPILMYDGSVKMVQDIKIGEQIMGDDSTPRNILGTCKGEEQMYKIILDNGDSFVANESHILSPLYRRKLFYIF